MIQYSLKCIEDHAFESWFQSADAFDKLRSAGLVTCPSCGNDHVDKAIMAPRVRTARSAGKPQAVPDAGSETRVPALTASPSPDQAALKKLKKSVQDNAEYVGSDFAAEARKIQHGDAPERSIYGEANYEEARQLVEDGVPVAPLPFIPDRKLN